MIAACHFGHTYRRFVRLLDRIRGISRRAITVFPGLKKNLGDHMLKDDRGAETVVTRWPKKKMYTMTRLRHTTQ